MGFSNRFFTVIATLFFIVSLASCSNSGGDSPQGTINKPTVAYDSYFVILKDDALLAINPLTPNAPIEIEPAGADISGTVIIPDLTTPPTDLNDFNQVNKFLVYTKDGKIWRVDLAVDSDLSPTQVSNEDNAFNICQAFPSIYTSPGTTSYNLIYTLPGPNGQCWDYLINGAANDNVTKSINLDMDATTAPDINSSANASAIASYNQITLQSYNQDTHSVETVGNLVVESNQDLNWYTGSTLSGTAKLLTTGVQKIEHLSMDLDDIQFIAIDNTLFTFDTASATLSEPLYTFESSPRDVKYEDNSQSSIYILDDTKILLLNLDPGESPVLIFDNTTNTGLSLHLDTIAQDYLIVSSYDSDTDQFHIYSVSKNSNKIVPLFSVSRTSYFDYFSNYIANDLMFYYDDITNTTRIISLDGSEKATLANTRPFTHNPILKTPTQVSLYLLLKYEASPTQTRIQLFNLQTLAIERQIGNLPRIDLNGDPVSPITTADIQAITFNGHYMLFTTPETLDTSSLYFADVTKDDSILLLKNLDTGTAVEFIGPYWLAPLTLPPATGTSGSAGVSFGSG